MSDLKLLPFIKKELEEEQSEDESSIDLHVKQKLIKTEPIDNSDSTCENIKHEPVTSDLIVEKENESSIKDPASCDSANPKSTPTANPINEEVNSELSEGSGSCIDHNALKSTTPTDPNTNNQPTSLQGRPIETCLRGKCQSSTTKSTSLGTQSDIRKKQQENPNSNQGGIPLVSCCPAAQRHHLAAPPPCLHHPAIHPPYPTHRFGPHASRYPTHPAHPPPYPPICAYPGNYRYPAYSGNTQGQLSFPPDQSIRFLARLTNILAYPTNLPYQTSQPPSNTGYPNQPQAYPSFSQSHYNTPIQASYYNQTVSYPVPPPPPYPPLPPSYPPLPPSYPTQPPPYQTQPPPHVIPLPTNPPNHPSEHLDQPPACHSPNPVRQSSPVRPQAGSISRSWSRSFSRSRSRSKKRSRSKSRSRSRSKRRSRSRSHSIRRRTKYRSRSRSPINRRWIRSKSRSRSPGIRRRTKNRCRSRSSSIRRRSRSRSRSHSIGQRVKNRSRRRNRSIGRRTNTSSKSRTPSIIRRIKNKSRSRSSSIRRSRSRSSSIRRSRSRSDGIKRRSRSGSRSHSITRRNRNKRSKSRSIRRRSRSRSRSHSRRRKRCRSSLRKCISSHHQHSRSPSPAKARRKMKRGMSSRSRSRSPSTPSCPSLPRSSVTSRSPSTPQPWARTRCPSIPRPLAKSRSPSTFRSLARSRSPSTPQRYTKSRSLATPRPSAKSRSPSTPLSWTKSRSPVTSQPKSRSRSPPSFQTQSRSVSINLTQCLARQSVNMNISYNESISSSQKRGTSYSPQSEKVLNNPLNTKIAMDRSQQCSNITMATPLCSIRDRNPPYSQVTQLSPACSIISENPLQMDFASGSSAHNFICSPSQESQDQDVYADIDKDLDCLLEDLDSDLENVYANSDNSNPPSRVNTEVQLNQLANSGLNASFMPSNTNLQIDQPVDTDKPTSSCLDTGAQLDVKDVSNRIQAQLSSSIFNSEILRLIKEALKSSKEGDSQPDCEQLPEKDYEHQQRLLVESGTVGKSSTPESITSHTDVNNLANSSSLWARLGLDTDSNLKGKISSSDREEMRDVQERSKGESSVPRSDVPLSPDAQGDSSSSHTPTEQGHKMHKEEKQPKKKKKKKKERSDSGQDQEKSLESEEYLSKDIEKLLKKKEALMKILNLLLKQKNTVLDQQHDAMTNFKGSRENLKTILDQNVSMVNEIGNQITTINGKVEKVNKEIKGKQKQLKKKTCNAATEIFEGQCSTTGRQEHTKLSSKDKSKSTPHDKQKKDKLSEERKDLSDSYSKKDISALVCEKESKTPSSKEAILNSQVNYESEKEKKETNSKCKKSVGSEMICELNPPLLTESVVGGYQEEDLPVAEVLCLLNDEDIVCHQSSDSTLKTLWEYAESGQVFTRGNKKHKYVTIHSRLYRQVTYRTGEVRNLFVVPAKYREALFELAHQSPLGGHYDTTKTFNRLQSFFFWPAHQEYVHKQWILCEKCQEPADKNQANPQTVFAEPFEKIGVDIVGPLFRKSSDGYEYILYVLDFETRWVEAVALKTINKENVAEALLVMLYRVGIPKELLSDCGSQFTLPMMNAVLEHLSAKGLRTILYHPMCNDLVSNIGGNLPIMFLRMVVDQPNDWPRYLAPLIYAYLQTPQSSSKLSSFDIAFGEMTRESFPRGSLEILREIWDGNIISPVVKLSYFNMLTLKDCLKETCKIGKQQLPKTPIMGKVVPDPNFVPRRFKKGDQCLIFQPTNNNKLQTSWDGPHTVMEGNGPLCWKIGNKKCWTSYHINMLKQYEKTVSRANVQTRLSQDQLEYLDLIRMHYSECRMPGSILGAVDSAMNHATARGAAVNSQSSAPHESSGVTLNTQKVDSQAGVSSHIHMEKKNPSQKTDSLECLKEIEIDSTKETKKLIMNKAKSEQEEKELEDGELEEGELEDD